MPAGLASIWWGTFFRAGIFKGYFTQARVRRRDEAGRQAGKQARPRRQSRGNKRKSVGGRT